MSKTAKPRVAATALPARMGQQMMELAVAVPQVMAHRLTRMALAGPTPSARDRREFKLMGDEKAAAFQQSLLAMVMQTAQVQQRMALDMMGAWLWPFRPMKPLASSWMRDGQAVLNKGLAPVHRRAVANARRLRTTPLR
jgi:hypothetical protein